MIEADLPMTGVGASLRRSLALLAHHRRVLAAVWAVLITAGAIAHFDAQPPQPLLQVRNEGVSRSIAVLDRGGPPLLVSNGPYAHGSSPGGVAPLGQGDDAGVYLYLPLLGRLTGERDPAVLMRWLFDGCLGLLLLSLPLVTFELFGSLLFAFLAPILVLWQFERVQGMDVYWIEAWCMLLCLPALLLAQRWWRSGLRRRAGPLLVGVALAAGFASSIRSFAGLAVLVDGLVVVLVGDLVAIPRGLRPARMPGLRRPARATVTRLGVAASLLLAYLCLSTFAVDAAAAYRDASVHMPSGASAAPTHRPDSAVALGALLGDALRRFWLAPILLAVGLAIPRRRRDAAVTAALAVPALAFGATALLAVPEPRYALGWTGAWGALWLLGIGWTLSELTTLRSRKALERLASSLRLRPALAVAVVAVLIGAAAASGTPAPARSTDGFYRAATTVPFAPQNVATVAAWRFVSALPTGWQATGAGLQADRSQDGRSGLFVKTTSARSAATVTGPWRLLPPGSYVLAEHGLVLTGGIALGVVSARGATLSSGQFSWRQNTWPGQPLTVGFRLRSPTRVRAELGSWGPAPSSSAFVVRHVSLQRLLPPATFYAPRATPLTPAPSSTASSVRVWPFLNGGTPQGVEPASGVEASDASGNTGVVTTTHPVGPQLLFDPLGLGAGRYAFSLGGSVEAGGLALEVLDASDGTRIATGRFWHAQSFAGRAMRVIVTLEKARTIRIVLANWAPAPASSQWVVQQLSVERLR